MLEFTIGAYLASTYTHAYIAYTNKFWEPMDGWDIMFFLLAPISYPICMIAALVKDKSE